MFRELSRARQGAATLLDTVWREDGPLPSPVDPILIARRLGIDVRLIDMDPDASAALVLTPRGDGEVDKVILINETHAPVRQRFSCAHELGHYYDMVTRGEPLDGTHVEWRDERAAKGTDPGERYANAFAAALLMPDELLSGMGARQQPVEAAYRLWVSQEALRHRLRSANV